MTKTGQYVTDVGWRNPENEVERVYEVTVGTPQREDSFFQDTDLDLVSVAKGKKKLPTVDTSTVLEHDGRTIKDLSRRITREDERYLIETEIGKGAEAEIFQVEDKTTGDKIAVKTCPELDDYRLVYEFNILQEIKDTGIAPQPIALIKEASQTWLFMELLDPAKYTTLRKIIRAELANIPQDKKDHLVKEMFDKYRVTEVLGRRHGDVSPENISIVLEPLELKFIDWASSYTGTKEGAGFEGYKREYASPERMGNQSIMGVDGVADNRDDLFSLTVIAFEIQVGKHPLKLMSELGVELKRKSWKQFWEEFSVAIQDPNFWEKIKDVDPKWRAFFQKGFATKLEDRFQSSDEALALMN